MKNIKLFEGFVDDKVIKFIKTGTKGNKRNYERAVDYFSEMEDVTLEDIEEGLIKLGGSRDILKKVKEITDEEGNKKTKGAVVKDEDGKVIDVKATSKAAKVIDETYYKNKLVPLLAKEIMKDIKK